MLTTLVALTGGVGAAVISAWAALHARRPRKSQLELVDVSISPSVSGYSVWSRVLRFDVKVRNIGGQPAVLKRLVVYTRQSVKLDSLWMPRPFDNHNGPMTEVSELPVSATYEVRLPALGEATDGQVAVDISQVVDPAAADRFEVKVAVDRAAYLLRLELRYDANDRVATSRLFSVAFQRFDLVDSALTVRQGIRFFRERVNLLREGVDREMAAHGHPVPDWVAAPPTHLDELPDGKVLVNSPEFAGTFVVNQDFWDPYGAIERHLRVVEKQYREILEVITPATVIDPELRAELPRVKASLALLPALHAEFLTPQKTMAREAAPISPDAAVRLARLLAEWLEVEPHARGLDARRGSLWNRYHLAQWRGEAGDPAGPAAAFAELVGDWVRVEGPDHRDTRIVQGQLKHWQVRAIPDS